MEEVKITKLVHGGQGLGELPDGRKVFVWNALPGETVRVQIIKSKRSYAEAIAEEVVTASPERIEPREANYLATSPWQMMTFVAENKYKKEIVAELFAHEKIQLPFPVMLSEAEASSRKGREDPSTSLRRQRNKRPVHESADGSLASTETVHGTVLGQDDTLAIVTAGDEWHYRNKMEYSFWGDDDGLHLALHQRGSHGKQVVTGSELAMPAVDAGARAIAEQLSKLNTRAGDLKTIVVRSSQKGKAVGALYTKLAKFTKLELPPELKGLRVYYSNPKSPASVPTELLYELGECTLSDELLGKPFLYDVDSFFQVNLPVYEKALVRIKERIQADPVDMYAGVGSIGLSVAKAWTQLVEVDHATASMAERNFEASGLKGQLIEASTEKALEYITAEQPIVFDPPRAGLHPKVVERILEVLPPQITYLSCNPATHVRDLKALEYYYNIDFFEIYNFFPRTPHIETLAVLSRKD